MSDLYLNALTMRFFTIYKIILTTRGNSVRLPFAADNLPNDVKSEINVDRIDQPSLNSFIKLLFFLSDTGMEVPSIKITLPPSAFTKDSI